MEEDLKSNKIYKAESEIEPLESNSKTIAQEGVNYPRERLSKFLYKYGVVAAFVFLLVLFSAILPSTFFTVGNFRTMVSSQAVLLIVALAMTLPLSAGEFDLSVGAMLGFSEVLVAHLTTVDRLGAVPAVAIALAVGLFLGWINGLFVVRFRVNALIITLGTSTVLAGLTLALSGGQIINLGSSSVGTLGIASFFGFPAPVYFAFLCALILWYAYEHTPFGRYLFFVGEGREVARLAGLKVNRIRWVTFVAAAALSSWAGVLGVGQLGAADPSVGASYLLPAFAAAFLGATTIKPGRFNSWGTVVATYLLIAGVTGLELLGASSWANQVFNGSALVIAVTLARVAGKDS